MLKHWLIISLKCSVGTFYTITLIKLNMQQQEIVQLDFLELDNLTFFNNVLFWEHDIYFIKFRN